MVFYKNLSGESGVYQFEIDSNFIKVRFQDNGLYLYNYAVTGAHDVEKMKALVLSGHGLNAFINRCVSKRYAA